MADEEERWLAAELKLYSDNMLEDKLENRESLRWWQGLLDRLDGVIDRTPQDKKLEKELQLIRNECKERQRSRRDLAADLKDLSDRELQRSLEHQKERLWQAKRKASSLRKEEKATGLSKSIASGIVDALLMKNNAKSQIQVIRNERRERERSQKTEEASRRCRNEVADAHREGARKGTEDISLHEALKEKESMWKRQQAALLREREEKHATVVRGLRNKLSQLESDLEAEREKNMCKICFVEPRNTVVLPCRHFLFCNSCLQLNRHRIPICPTCRVRITGSMALYMP